MKRSEMKTKIYNALYSEAYAEDWVEQILSTVESLGMIPPYYYVPITDPFEISLVGPGPVAVKGWEPEDEKINETQDTGKVATE